jgi:hypothetical protein
VDVESVYIDILICVEHAFGRIAGEVSQSPRMWHVIVTILVRPMIILIQKCLHSLKVFVPARDATVTYVDQGQTYGIPQKL